MNSKLTIAALLAATAATAPVPALAQTGLRADVHVGWDGISTHQRTDVGTSGATTRSSDDGVIYGVELGYDLAVSNFRIGVYGGLDGSSTKRCSEVFAEVETCAKAGRSWTAGVRAGVNVTPRILLYAKGGYSNGAMNFDYIDHATPANSFSASETMDGYHLGAGVQVNLLSNVYAKLEYVRTDYEDYAMKEGTATITGGVDRDNVLFGVGLAF